MNVELDQIVGLFQAWLWPFMRIGAMFAAAPVFGTQSVPVRIRIGLTLAVSLVIVPVLPAQPAIDALSGVGVMIGMQQLLIGLGLGLTLRLVVMAFELAGQVTAQLMGLHFASMVDPQNGNSVPVISQFYIIMSVLVFLSINGHLILIQVLADSFTTMPIGTGGVTRDHIWQVLNWAGWLFAQAVLIALPAIATMLLVNISFGVITRSAPQLNIFAVGFPIMIVLGFTIMFLSLPTVVPHIVDIYTGSLRMAAALFGQS